MRYFTKYVPADVKAEKAEKRKEKVEAQVQEAVEDDN